MSLINQPEILAGLQHDDIFVRSGMLGFVGTANVSCPIETSRIALDMIEKYGWSEAFDHSVNLRKLPIDRETGQRLIQLLDHKSLSELPEYIKQLAVGHALGWIAAAPFEVCAALHNDIQTIAVPPLHLERKEIEIRAEIANNTAEQCFNSINRFIEECDHPEHYPGEDIFQIACYCERLAELDAVDPDMVQKWIALPLELDDGEWSKDSIRVWIGLLLAKQARIPVAENRYLELIDIETEMITESLAEALIKTASADDLLKLIEIFPSLQEESRISIVEVFEKLRHPEAEIPLRNLARSGKLDWYSTSMLGPAVAYYATESSIEVAEQLSLDVLEDEDRIEIEQVLYPFYKVLNIESPHLDRWREKFRDIKDAINRLWQGSDFSSGAELYEPLSAPDPATWLAMDDSEKQALVEGSLQYIEGGIGEGFVLHCMTHVIVENQIAMKSADTPTGPVIEKLIKEGLNRHEAIHAVGSVVMTEMHSMIKEQTEFDPSIMARAMQAIEASDWKGSAPFNPGIPDDLDEDYEGEFNGFEDEPPLWLGSTPAVQTVRNESPKIGRNDPCPCGSGKKYKKCCIEFAN